MVNCLLKKTTKKVIPIVPINKDSFKNWQDKESKFLKGWVKTSGFSANPGEICMIPDKNGELDRVLIGLVDADDFTWFDNLQSKLPDGQYNISAKDWSSLQLERAVYAFAMGSYSFDKYKKTKRSSAQLVIPEGCDYRYLENIIATSYWMSDMIRTPAENMGPKELSDFAVKFLGKFDIKVREVVGEKLLKENYPAVYAVGKGSNRESRLIEILWGKNKNAPKVTLIGKGVCFDSGGLCLKPGAGMGDMKKDMAGAAHALALASMIMSLGLNVNLRVIIPAVENVISGHSYKPADIIATRKGKTVEVINTDAEGRLILADALTLACEDKPDLLIDFATLTGAIHVALGVEITGMFTDDDALARGIIAASKNEKEPLWRMPLYHPYRDYIESKVADLGNVSNNSGGGGGAITAALFLNEFVTPGTSWVHFDLASANGGSRSGRAKNAEVMCLRGILRYLREKYA